MYQSTEKRKIKTVVQQLRANLWALELLKLGCSNSISHGYGNKVVPILKLMSFSPFRSTEGN